MLTTFKAVTGCEDETLAQYFIDRALQVVKDYTKRNTHTATTLLKSYVLELAVIYYNQKGAEGLQSQSYSGVSENYIEDIPQSMKQGLNAYRYFTREKEV